jgi:hypothetical protein
MKRIALVLLAVSLLAFTLSSNAFAADMAIVSCDIIPVDISSKTPTGRPEFQIIVMSFSASENGLLTVQKDIGSSCVKVLARLVNNKNIKIKGISSTDNGPAYTLLWKEGIN